MTLEATKYEASKVKPFTFHRQRQATALAEAQELISLNGLDGQKLVGLHFNRAAKDNLAIVWLTGMFENANSLDLRYTGYQLAAANPRHQVLVINLPAHGPSDPLSANQRKQILETKQLSKIADSQAVAAALRLSGNQQVLVSGQSAGARLAPDFANKISKLGLEPRALVGFNMAGLDKRPSLNAAVGYFLDGFLRQYKYHQGAANKALIKALQTDFKEDMMHASFRGDHNPLTNVINVFKNDPSYFAYLFVRSPLASNNGFKAIEKTLKLNHNLMVYQVSSGLDKVNRWRKIEPTVEKLVQSSHPRLKWAVWGKDSHAMGIGPQMPRFAAVIKDVIGSL